MVARSLSVGSTTETLDTDLQSPCERLAYLLSEIVTIYEVSLTPAAASPAHRSLLLMLYNTAELIRHGGNTPRASRGRAEHAHCLAAVVYNRRLFRKGERIADEGRMVNAHERKLDKSTTLSIVVPVYNEEQVLGALFDRITKVANRLPVSVEVVLVNDGSRDRSLEVMCGFVERDPRFRVVDLSRNFGNQYALSAAFHIIRGDVVAILDADLQDPPEVLDRMLERWAAGIDVVYGQRASREGEGRFKLITAKLFYRLLSRVSNVDIPKDTGDFRVADRRVIDIINTMPERHPFLRGLYAWVGFRQEPFLYDRQARVGGQSKYSVRRMLVFSVDGLLSFSMKPLRWIACLGLVMTMAAFVSGICLLLGRFMDPGAPFPMLAGTFVAMFFMFGIQLIGLGVIGEYVGRIYANVQGRPSFIVRRIIENIAASDDRDRVTTGRDRRP